MSSNQKKICVIGGGASGLTSIKQCLENDFSVTCYEKTPYIGGLWKYHEEDEDGIASVMKSTIINSSKEMSSFSNFLPDANLPNYMHNTNMVRYLEDYANQFDLRPHIKTNHEVISVKRSTDYDESGKWLVSVRNVTSGEESKEIFDGVLICTGHHVKPLIPVFEGEENFKGKIFHSHSYKKPTEDFVGKSFLVIGVGNSGGDVAVELSNVASKCYLSTRRGVWVTHRVGHNGWPMDCAHLTRSWMGLLTYVPFFLGNYIWERQLNARFDHVLYNIKPKHHVTGQHVMINDALPNKLLSGMIMVKRNVKKFTPDGVIFEGENEETKIDIVVLATGYLINFPFLEDGILDMDPKKNAIKNLYKYVFPANLKHPTLAFIGLIQPIGAIFPISESQARWFCELMKGNVTPPSVDEMIKDIEKKRKEIESRYYEGERHTIQVDWLPYMDEINSMIGTKPDLIKYLFSDFTLWRHLFFGPAIPAQYRLQGPNQWDGARDAILGVEERIRTPLNSRGMMKEFKSETNFIFCLKAIGYIIIAYSVINFIFEEIIDEIFFD